MSTVDSDPRFVVVWPEEDSLSFTPLMGREKVRDHYSGMRQTMDVVAARPVRQVVSDWFVFQENVSTMANGNSEDPGGGLQQFSIETAAFFPVGTDGILGEFTWNRTSFAEAARLSHHFPEPTADGLESIVDLHDALLDALRHADVGAITTLLAEDCIWATRDYAAPGTSDSLIAAAGRKDVTDALHESLAGWAPQTATVLDRVVTSWYVFADVLWTWPAPDGERAVRTGTIARLASPGRFAGVIGYGSDVIDTDSDTP
jgi:hypothetical protein